MSNKEVKQQTTKKKVTIDTDQLFDLVKESVRNSLKESDSMLKKEDRGDEDLRVTANAERALKEVDQLIETLKGIVKIAFSKKGGAGAQLVQNVHVSLKPFLSKVLKAYQEMPDVVAENKKRK